MSARLLVASLVVLLTGSPAHAQLDQLLKGLGVGGPSQLSDAKIGAGLKQALEVATGTRSPAPDGSMGTSPTRQSRF